jgi:hypothetical protein
MPLISRLSSVCVLLTVSCGVPSWPVPVPAEKGFDGYAQRVELPLPLCGKEATCDKLVELRALLGRHAQRCAQANRVAALPADLETLIAALRTPGLHPTDVPKNAAFPTGFRALDSFPAADSRDDSTVSGIAVSYRGLWWSFWERAAISETPAKAAGLNQLIVFDEFEGRPGCEGW